MRVTMVNKYYPPHIGGIEFHVRDLAEGLAERDDFDVRAIVANEATVTVRETVGGVDVLRLSRSVEYASTPVAFGMPGAIREAARGAGATDIFHLHFPYPWGEAAWLSSGSGVATVLSYHSDIVRQKKLLALYGPLLRRILDSVDLIVAGSPQMVRNSPWLAPREEKCRVVPYGIHVERFASTPETLSRAAELKAAHGRPIVLAVGRLVYYKGLDVLLEAMKDIDADLVLIGRGPLEAPLREQAVASGIADRVTFLQPQSDPELAAWFHAAHVMCLPSTSNSEAFGIVQIEAHASGTPVVSTDLPTGVPYANLHDETGLIVPVGDAHALSAAVRRLLEDEALRERLGTRARERAVDEFALPRMVESMAAVYQEARARHDGPRAREARG